MIGMLYNDNKLKELSYSEQLTTIQKMKLVFGNGFSLALESLGHEVHDIICDIRNLQFTWARENNYKINNNNSWIAEISLEQIKSLKPDIIFCHNIDPWESNIFMRLKLICPSIKLISAYVGFPQLSYDRFSNVDLFFGGVPFITKDASDLGIKSYTMYQSFDTQILDQFPLSDNQPYERESLDFVFSGGYDGHHRGRYYLLKELLDTTNLECWLMETIDKEKPINNGNKKSTGYLEKSQSKKQQWIDRLVKKTFKSSWSEVIEKLGSADLLNRLIQGLTMKSNINNFNENDRSSSLEKLKPISVTLKELFPNRVHAPVFGLEMYDLFRRSKLILNKHVDEAKGFVGNMRLFEVTGMGTCLLSDNGYNMTELFEENKEIVTYNTLDEAIEKSNYLLSNDIERRNIAKAGQRKTLTEHSVYKRAEQMDGMLQRML